MQRDVLIVNASLTQAVLIFAKQENEEVFHPLHLVPPSLVGLAVAVSNLNSIVCHPILIILMSLLPDSK